MQQNSTFVHFIDLDKCDKSAAIIASCSYCFKLTDFIISDMMKSVNQKQDEQHANFVQFRITSGNAV